MAHKNQCQKGQVVHARNYQKPRSSVLLHCCGQKLDYTETYKYLAYFIHENLSEVKTVDALTSAGVRSFGRVVNI